mmetsp:Transcript_18531/g.26176  ORF Transcript_18531/g.26176 Transcript_18531/m.26176 type:complete len:270 (+) Transcript_18531:37-846(+)
MTNHQKSKRNSNKRKRSSDEDPFKLAYQNASFTCIPSTARPGSPHRYFKESFAFSLENKPPSESVENDADTKIENDPSIDVVDKKAKIDQVSHQCLDKEETQTSLKKQVIHHHANGLCIITAGDSISDMAIENDIERIEFIAKMSSESMSAGEKRKQQAKMMRGKASAIEKEGVVTPSTVLAKIHFQKNKAAGKIYAGVWGNLVELNERLTPELLKSDPLLEGYIAIVLPTGPFPPPPTDEQSKETSSINEKDNEVSLIPTSILEKIEG